jgi:hypothetical protein
MDTDCAFLEVGAEFLYIIYTKSSFKSVNVVLVFFTADCRTAAIGGFLERSAFRCAVTLRLLPREQLNRLWEYSLIHIFIILTKIPRLKSGCAT